MLQREESQETKQARLAIEQAKARLANAKKKDAEKKRKAENHHKYMMGGIVAKYFPECYSFEEHELNRILASAIKSRECTNIIEIVKKENAGNGDKENEKRERVGESQNDVAGVESE
jgi:hypothetical protein